MKFFTGKRYIFGLILLVLFISSCGSSDKKYTPPEKVEADSQAVPSESSTTSTLVKTTSTTTPTTTSTTTTTTITTTSTTTSTTIKQPVTFNIEETATDNQLKVTVNGVRFLQTIDEQNNPFLIAKATSGNEYAIVDLTVENILSDSTQSISTLLGTSIIDQEGYTYKIDFTGLVGLSKSFKDGEILPGMKNRGEITFLVPSSANDLKFIYKFDVFVGTSAVFDIK